MAQQYDSGEGLNPVWLANNKLRRRKYDECIEICTALLEKNPYDQVRLRGLRCRILFLRHAV